MTRHLGQREYVGADVDGTGDGEALSGADDDAVGADGIEVAPRRAGVAELGAEDRQGGPHGVAGVEDPRLPGVEPLLGR